MGIDGATVLGVGLIVGGIGLLAIAMMGLGRRYGLFGGRRKRRIPRAPIPVRPQRTDRPEARREPSQGNDRGARSTVNLGRTNPALRPRAGDPRQRGNERPQPIVDPRRVPPIQPGQGRNPRGNQSPSAIRATMVQPVGAGAPSRGSAPTRTGGPLPAAAPTRSETPTPTSAPRRRASAGPGSAPIAPSRETPSREMPAREVPTHGTPTRERFTREAPAREASSREMPAREASSREMPAGGASGRWPDEAVDTLLLHEVPAWSQPAGPLLREPPRNDPPRTDLVATAFGATEPQAAGASEPQAAGATERRAFGGPRFEEPTEVAVAPRSLVMTETVAEMVIETVIVETMPRGDA